MIRKEHRLKNIQEAQAKLERAVRQLRFAIRGLPDETYWESFIARIDDLIYYKPEGETLESLMRSIEMEVE